MARAPHAGHKKEYRLITAELESQVAMPSDGVEQKKWLGDLVGAALDYLVQESSKLSFL